MASGFCTPSRTARFGRGDLGFERVRQSRDNLVLHVEEIGDRLVETLGPEVAAALGFSCSNSSRTTPSLCLASAGGPIPFAPSPRFFICMGFYRLATSRWFPTRFG